MLIKAAHNCITLQFFKVWYMINKNNNISFKITLDICKSLYYDIEHVLCRGRISLYLDLIVKMICMRKGWLNRTVVWMVPNNRRSSVTFGVPRLLVSPLKMCWFSFANLFGLNTMWSTPYTIGLYWKEY